MIGLIFDWDGVVIDSSEFHEKSWDVLSQRENLPLFEGHFKIGFGKRNETIIPEILKWSQEEEEVKRLAFEKEEIYRELIREHGIEALPGVRELLESAKLKKIPCVIGSSTPRDNLICALEILGLEEFFVDKVSGDDVENGKPNPEVFLKCAKIIDRLPGKCVVFEDSFSGIEAGKNGGMYVVGVATTHPADKLTRADETVSYLSEVNLEELHSKLT